MKRAEAWDNELDRIARTEIVKEATAKRKNYLDTADEMLEWAREALKNNKPEDATPKDIKEFVKIAAELEKTFRLLDADEITDKSDDGFIEALNSTAADDWGGDDVF